MRFVDHKLLHILVLCLCSIVAGCTAYGSDMTTDDKAAIEETRRIVFAAYKAGDLDTMMAHFHPDVIQIPSYDKVLTGKADVRANYAAALSLFTIELNDSLEDLYIDGDIAGTHGLYTVTLTPKDGGPVMRRSGRYMVIMKRWPESPTGWSTYRELVQPETS